ncbi:hypothetical protein GIB67_027439 [Kingdonia uniflora]|uniref:SWIM-type domain-containing protein n=1 Tax=Kingdonia uniflora TaxID=39325 RepID=A0A7J7MFI0_9MAGN|nr:hypothetical protein GIB67_027439 [Kingdonia uniflora]
MNGVQLCTIVHFGGDIVRPKIGSIVSYVGGSTKLTSLRAHSSYEDFVTLLEETREIHRKDWLSTTKDTGSGKGLPTTKAGGPLRHSTFPDPESEYRSYPEINGRGLVPPELQFESQPEHVKDLVDFRFKFAAYTEDPYEFSKEFNIGDLYRDRIELKNHIRAYAVVNKFNLEYVLSNEYKIVVRCKGHKCSWQTYAIRLVGSALFRVNTYYSVHTWIRVETEGGNAYKAAFSRWVASIIKQKLQKDPNYKPSEIIDDMQIQHNIDVPYNLAWRSKEKAHAEMRGSFEHAYQLLTSYFAEVRLVDPDFELDIQTTSYKDKRFTRYGVAYTNNVESLNNVILKARDLPIYVFIEELRRIRSEMSYTYREEAEKSQARLMPWATDHCESKNFVADSLTCKVRTSRHHFQMTSYSRTDSVNIEDGTCLCRWWQTIGIPCKHGVRVLNLSNVDPTTRVFEYFTNDTYKAAYKPIWIPKRGIEQ